jgi:MoaA/NifB/PqqE/SkfB family radical SAM enzyme
MQTHVNADGYVEPCPFSHFAADNVCDKPLEEILRSPFLSQIRQSLESTVASTEHCFLFDSAGMVEKIAARTGGFRTDGPLPLA